MRQFCYKIRQLIKNATFITKFLNITILQRAKGACISTYTLRRRKKIIKKCRETCVRERGCHIKKGGAQLALKELNVSRKFNFNLVLPDIIANKTLNETLFSIIR